MSTLLSTSEPKGFKSAVKHPGWLAIINEEIRALYSNGTWELVPCRSDTNIVGSKWVFRMKYLSDGSVDRLKARLVAQGYTKILGLDSDHTFSPVVKVVTVRVVLSMAVMQRWPLHQLDVKKCLFEWSFI